MPGKSRDQAQCCPIRGRGEHAGSTLDRATDPPLVARIVEHVARRKQAFEADRAKPDMLTKSVMLT